MKKNVFMLLAAALLIASCSKHELETIDPIVESAELKSSGTMVTLHSSEIISEYSQLFNAVGYIKVKNVGYNKNVTVHYTSDNNGPGWYDVEAEYYQTIEDGYEIWKFSTPDFSWHRFNSPSITFAIRYEVNGQVYWDNNGGEDYSMYIDLGSRYQDFLLGPETQVLTEDISIEPRDATFTTIEWSGHVQNLGYEKEILVVFSTDNWATSMCIGAKYANDGTPIQPGIEKWTATSTIPVGMQGKYVQSYIAYTVNGQTYYDNNFTLNYVFDHTN
jgi:hypothetical protein